MNYFSSIQTVPTYIVKYISEDFSKYMSKDSSQFFLSYQKLNPMNMIEKLSKEEAQRLPTLMVDKASVNKHSLKALFQTKFHNTAHKSQLFSTLAALMYKNPKEWNKLPGCLLNVFWNLC